MWQVRCPGLLSSWDMYLFVCSHVPTYHNHMLASIIYFIHGSELLYFKGFKMIEELVRRGANKTAQLVKCHHTIMWPEFEPQHPYRKPGWLGPICNPSTGGSMGFTSLPAFLGKAQVPVRDTFSKNKVDRTQGITPKADFWLPYVHALYINMPI